MLARQSANNLEREIVADQPFEPYRQVNAYTHTPSPEQVITIFIFAGEVTLHSVFVAPAIPQQASPILWVLLGLTYLSLLFILFDYFYLTCCDPADRLLFPNHQDPGSVVRLRACLDCHQLVQVDSYHCKRCRRCVEQFDHHCKYLNNCIGGQNYQAFIRLLLILTFFSLTLLAEALWTFLLATSDPELSEKVPSRWGMLASLIVTLLNMIAVDSLLCFHCYIVLYLETSTVDFLWDRQSEPHSQLPAPSTDPQLVRNPRTQNVPMANDILQ